MENFLSFDKDILEYLSLNLFLGLLFNDKVRFKEGLWLNLVDGGSLFGRYDIVEVLFSQFLLLMPLPLSSSLLIYSKFGAITPCYP